MMKWNQRQLFLPLTDFVLIQGILFDKSSEPMKLTSVCFIFSTSKSSPKTLNSENYLGGSNKVLNCIVNYKCTVYLKATLNTHFEIFLTHFCAAYFLGFVVWLQCSYQTQALQNCGIVTLFREMPHYNQPKGSQGCKEGKTILQNACKHVTHRYISL